VDQLAAHLQPGWLDGQFQRALDVTHLAGGAGQEFVYPLLGHFGPALHELPQEEPLASRRFRFPTTPIVLIALVHAVAALGASIGVPGHVVGDAPLALAGDTLFGRALEAVAYHADDGLKSPSQVHEGAHGAVARHLAGVHDAVGVHLLLKALQPAYPLGAQHGVGFAGKVVAGGVGPTAVFLGNLDDGQGQAKGHIVAQGPLVVGDKAEQRHLAVAIDHALHDQRLLDGLFDLVQGLAQVLYGHHHLGGQQARPQALDVHQVIALIPLVVGNLLTQQLAAMGFDNAPDDVFGCLPALSRGDEYSRVAVGHTGPMLVHGMAVLQLGRQLVLEAGHGRIDKADRPQRRFLLDQFFDGRCDIVG